MDPYGLSISIGVFLKSSRSNILALFGLAANLIMPAGTQPLSDPFGIKLRIVGSCGDQVILKDLCSFISALANTSCLG